jgi:hypothetical protein
MTRQRFLGTGTGLIVGTLAASSGAIALFAPTRTWALELNAVDEHVGKTLLLLTREIYPHDTLDDAVYALVVKGLDVEAAGSEETRELLNDGVAEMDKTAGGSWLDLSPEQRTASVEAMAAAGNPLFKKAHGKATVSLYDNDMAYAHFGYEGPSFARGGYMNHGFQDLSWLPDPPAEAARPPGLRSEAQSTTIGRRHLEISIDISRRVRP